MAGFLSNHHIFLIKGADSVKFPFSMIWDSKAKTSGAFFAWKAATKNIITLNKLIKRGKIMAIGCYLCNYREKTCNHILFWCLFAHRLLSLAYGLLGVDWVIAGTVKDEL